MLVKAMIGRVGFCCLPREVGPRTESPAAGTLAEEHPGVTPERTDSLSRPVRERRRYRR